MTSAMRLGGKRVRCVERKARGDQYRYQACTKSHVKPPPNSGHYMSD
jgi:hypothetical protein